MASYKCTYHNPMLTTAYLDAKTKAEALSQLRQHVAPMCKKSVFAKRVQIERVKVVKSVGFNCAVCRTVVPRKEFVSHVRTQHA